MKSRNVLMIADVENWAYDNIAKSISGKFRKYEAKTVYFRDLIRGNDTVDARNYDVIMGFFWYDMLLRGGLIENLDVNKVCITVQSHNSWLKRGMTLEEYIAEAFTMLENKPVTILNNKMLYQSTAGLDAEGNKVGKDD